MRLLAILASLQLVGCGLILGLEDVRLASDGGAGSDGGDGSVDANLALCGNGEDDPGEQCDDNNLSSGDGCSAVCKDESVYCNPTAVGNEYTLANPAGRMVADGNYLYVAGAHSILNPTLRILDVSDPASIGETGTFQLTDYPSSKTLGIAKRGDFIWLAGNDPGLYSVDVSNVSAPVQGAFQLNPTTDGHIARTGDDFLLASTSIAERPAYYDISPGTSIASNGSIGNAATVYYNVGASSTLMFASTYGSAVHLADSPAAPASSQVVGTYTHGTAWSGATAVRKIVATPTVLAFAVTGANAPGVHLVDVSLPSAPSFGSTIAMQAEDLALAGNYLYIPETDGLKVYDISDSDAPALAGSIVDFAFYTTSVAVDPDSGRAYMAGESNIRVLEGLPGICNAVCGNYHQEYPEECDDGNLSDGDGCEADCTTTP